jgi:hypothetical protein
MNEEQQRSFFGSIFSLPMRNCSIWVGQATGYGTESPAITISTPALLEALPQLSKDARRLTVANFALTRQSDVQALSNIILAKCETLRYLNLECIECPYEDLNEEDSHESNGFLDPLFYAASGVNEFLVSTKTRSVHSTLVSPRALRALVVEGQGSQRLYLNHLGLNDSHILAIVDGLSTRGTHLSKLNLESNPGITAQGYGALLNLINGTNAVGSVYLFSTWYGQDKKAWEEAKGWEDKIRLVSEMNLEYGRLEYLMNGTFTSEEHRWQWLERVANLPSSDKHSDYAQKKWDAKHLNFIWYTLCQNPEMMQT